jgi:predicted NAD/FAD-binding protein
LRFFHNHGFLGLHSPHPWLTVDGGAKSYVEKLTAPWRDRIHLRQKVIRILRSDTVSGATLNTAQGESLHFDKVILACHADQALRLLVNPTPDEARLLGEFHYLPSIATLHTDASVMPRTPRAWSSWNLQIAVESDERIATSTHYWMNRLQGVSSQENYFVSLNQLAPINSAKVLQTIPYEHPLFNLGAVRAQSELPSLNTQSPDQSTYFCGSYFRYGFHEDAFASAVKVCEAILARNPWTASS